MDVAKLNQEILGVDLEYKNVYIDDLFSKEGGECK